MQTGNRLSSISIHFLLLVIILLTCPIRGKAQLAQTIWGMTVNGGTSASGTLFSSAPDGSNLTVRFSFPSSTPGINPITTLTETPDGKLYGFTSNGGLKGFGVLFEFDPVTKSYTRRADFSGGAPIGRLILAGNGKLYGVADVGGANNGGYLFEFDPATKALSTKYDFSASAGQQGLMLASNGKLYGITSYGGASVGGNIFSFDVQTGTFSNITDLAFSAGNGPAGPLMQASDGKLYGVTQLGGSSGKGALFEFNTGTGAVALKYSFTSAGGGSPVGPLVERPNGMLIGVTQNGGVHSNGTLFDYDIANNTFTNRFDFDFIGPGRSPVTGLTLASSGLVYGVAQGGVATASGCLFQYDPTTHVYTKKYDFLNSDIFNPMAYPMEASNHKIYGTARNGGAGFSGGLYEYDPAADKTTKVIDFQSSPLGYSPRGALLQTSSGKVYGTTSLGGAAGLGTIFEVDIYTGVISLLAEPTSALGTLFDGGLVELNGILYGVAQSGGANNNGTIYSFNPQTKTITKVVDFTGNTGAFLGGSPNRSLVVANGKLYGTTRFGSTAPGVLGTLFEYDPANSAFTSKVQFNGSTGISPRGLMVLASNGKLYGTLGGGAANNVGGLYEFDPVTGSFAKKIDFSSTTGTGNFGVLTEGAAGKIYLTTLNEGLYGNGTIYEYNINTGTGQVVHDFTTADGTTNSGGLLRVANNKLYGLSGGGGANGIGTWYEFDPATAIFTKKLDFDGNNGATPGLFTPIQLRGSDQTITFGAIPAKKFNESPLTLSVSASSGLPVTVTSSNPAVATVSGTTITFTGVGTTTITASQTGNSSFYAAPAISQVLTVNKGDQVITFGALADKKIGDPAFTLAATSSASLPVTFSTTSSIIGISGSTVTINSAGTADIIAAQAGNALYNSAQVTQTLHVNAVTGLEPSAVSLQMFPNPASDYIRIMLPAEGTLQKIRVMTLDGKVVHEQGSENREETIDVSSYPRGMYLISVQTDKRVYWDKLLRN